jgi:hypothetical protein
MGFVELGSAALIPLEEFCEQELVRKYEVDLDLEVLDLLDTASRQKQVHFFTFLFEQLCIFFCYDLQEGLAHFVLYCSGDSGGKDLLARCKR